MSRRFHMHVSKFRNIECQLPSREESFQQLHITNANVDGNILAATMDHFAFPHQIDGGSAIQVKSYQNKGKEAASTPPLLRGHRGHVNALEFSPFDSRLLASGGADNLVKIWMLPSEEMYEDIVNDSSTFNTSDSIITCLRFHPSADKILASSSIKDVFLYDLTTEETIYHLRDLHEAQITGLTWNYDGSLLISGSQDKKLRMFDPRNDSQSVHPFEAHTGKRGFNVVWCGRLEHFLTFGHDNMQEREVKLWDPRNLSRHVARERIDSCVGSLLPVYDDDINLVYLAGKGDSSIRCLEIDSNKPFLHSLDHIALSNTCMAIAMVPKQQLDTNKCEVGRILMLSQGAVEPLSFQVPRKDAVHTFQNDLYPDTKAFKSAMIGNDWKQNRNQEPLVEKVNPTEKHDDPVSLSSGVGGGSVWITTGGGWDALSTAGSESCTAGWGRESTRISTTEAIIETPKEAHHVLHPTKSKDSEVHQVEQQEQPPRRESMNVNIELSDKAKRLGSIYSHKLKYIKGKQSTKTDSFSLADKSMSYASGSAGSILKANAKHWAVPLAGPGGPVYVGRLGETGKCTANAPVLNGQRSTVVDLDFSPFNDDILATGSGDSSIQLWNLEKEPNEPAVSLSGHKKSIRCVDFHPTAENVLASNSLDLTLRLWDVEYGKEKNSIEGKMDKPLYNMSFNYDGSLLAASGKDKVLRIFDPRNNGVLSMGCGHEGAKAQFVTWCSTSSSIATSYLLSVGFNARNERQINIWDARNLLDPAFSTTIDASGSILYPFFDEMASVLYLVGSGDRTILSYEINTSSEQPVGHACLPYTITGDPIYGAALLPSALCDIRQVEISRMLLLTSAGNIETLSFSIPRADKLLNFYQDDIFGLVRAKIPSMTCQEWFDGSDKAPILTSMKPNDMINLSEKPINAGNALKRPKTLEFQTKLRHEEENEHRKAEQFARLSSLAHQPSLHTTRGGVTTRAAEANANDSSDDDWDD